jgi:oligoendopeptidase F
MTAAQSPPLEEVIQARHAVDQQFQWNVEALYPSWKEWEEDLAQWGREGSTPHWPELNAFRTNWKESPHTLKALLDLFFEIDRHLSKLYTYAHLRHDEDVAADEAKTPLRISPGERLD